MTTKETTRASKFLSLVLRHQPQTAHIRAEGLKKMARHHVHLSEDIRTTLAVGGRHGSPDLLTIRTGDMHRAGWTFHRSTNGVWLVDAVPPEFIGFPAS